MFSLASQPMPGRPNEDFVIATPDLAIVVDGAGMQEGRCRHSVAWYAQQLATRTVTALIDEPHRTLSEGLAAGIVAVYALHAETCDLVRGGPCAAVGILRRSAGATDVLSLSDVAVVVDTSDGGPEVFCDLAMEGCTEPETLALAGRRLGTPEHAAALSNLVARQALTRNRANGWWIASSDPRAAEHAVVGTFPQAEVRRAAVLSDGAARPVMQMGIYGWPKYLDLLEELGPAGLISHVRSIEADDPDAERYPRTKRHDDATVARLSA
jgi:hypothetical protein